MQLRNVLTALRAAGMRMPRVMMQSSQAPAN
jgi:hypothetical protein